LNIKSNNQHVAYSQDFSWPVARANLLWYMDRLGLGSSAPKYLAIMSIILVLVARATRSTLLVAVAILVAVPFVFLQLRRNTYFIHLAYVFLMVALVFAACRLDYRVPRSMAFALLLGLVGYSSFHLHRDTYLEPLGSDLKRELTTIRGMLAGTNNTVCMAYGIEDSRTRHQYHVVTDSLRAYSIVDPQNFYIHPSDPACASAPYRLIVHKEDDGTLHHVLVDTRSGESFSTRVMPLSE
jgi:hypothetical protein